MCNQMADNEGDAITITGEETILMKNGDPLPAGSVVVRYIDLEEVSNDVMLRDQLEIEFPDGEAIHTIQLQSPGGTTCIMEGVLVRTNTGVAGFQVVNIMTDEKGKKTIFLVPSAAGDEDVEVDDVQQEQEQGMIDFQSADDDDIRVMEKETAKFPDVMVKEETEDTEVNNFSPPKPVPESITNQEMGAANFGDTTTTAKSHERPKRKAGKPKPVAIVSPKKKPRKKPAKKAKPKSKVVEVVDVPGPTKPVKFPKINIPPTESTDSSVSVVTANKVTSHKKTNVKDVTRKTRTPKPAKPDPALGDTSNSTLAMLTSTLPPPPPIWTVPPTTSSQGVAQGSSLLPQNEDVVLESDDDEDKSAQKKCVICLRRRRFTEDIFDTNNKDQPLQHMQVLFSQVNVPIRMSGKPSEEGVCTFCLDQLQRSHIFNSVIKKRHETLQSSGAVFDDTPIRTDEFETRLYKNFKKMTAVKEIYLSATHSHLTRRIFTEKDWDFFCDRYNKSMKSVRELERYIMSREKLTHIFCIKCQQLVKNGKKGFVKHMKTQHPQAPIMFPCEICGNHFPDKDKDMTSTVEEYYTHWISHFYSISCEICDKRLPSKRSLGQHRISVHKIRSDKSNSKSKSQITPVNEDRSCDASSEMKEALVSDLDVVHSNLKKCMCKICGKTFKNTSSLRGHVRRHEGRKDYKCEVCHKDYNTYTDLKGHKLVHQTAKDFICDICGKGFKKKKALMEHESLHTGVKPYKCSICGRDIRVKSNLYKHMKIHQKNAEQAKLG